MNRKTAIVISIAVIALLGSCEFALGPRAEGTLVLNLGGGPASRAFSDPPFSGLPVFSSVTVTVSGSGMPTASKTVPGTAGSVTIQVPAGPARKVEVYAVPDWAATPQTPQPTLAKAYGGTAIVDVAGGQTVSVALDMGVVETKILLPDLTTWSIADSISTDPVAYEWSYLGGFFQFDRFGRLITLDGQNGITIYNEPYSVFDQISEVPFGPFAYSRSEEGIYIASSGTAITFMDSSYATSSLTLDQAFEIVDAVAVDEDGFVYLAGDDRVRKYRVDHTQGTASQDGSATYESLGLGYWVTSGETYFNPLTVQDMTVQDGRLYIAAAENDFLHHGKVVEVNLSSLAKLREIGWSPSSPTKPASQFYGPSRFLAIVPRKLIVADEGYDNGNKNRIVEVDLESWSMSAKDTTVEFFTTYYC